MVLLVGNRYKMGALSEVLKNRLNEDVIFLEENINILKQENEILSYGDVNYIIYDTEQYYNEAEEMIDIIKRIYRTNKARVILYVASTNPKNDIIKNAVAKQIKSFVCSSLTMAEQKDELEKAISGFYEANPTEDVIEAEKEVFKEHKKLNDFVEELYDAKQREEEKENTIIINKKTNTEVFFGIAIGMIKTILSIVSIILMSIALITLVYEESRVALFNVLTEIYNQVVNSFN